jgi:branched-chain amino acid transport system permease protein
MTAEIVLQSVVSGLMFGGVIALVAVGLSLIWGVMDVINFAYGEFLMWAMYLTFFLYAGAGLEPVLSLPVNAVVLFGAGVLTYRLVIRTVLKGPIFAQLLSTFGLFVLLRYVAWLLFRPDDRQAQSALATAVISLAGLRVSAGELVAFAGSVLATSALFWFLKWTKTGKALRAVAQDREAALALGIETDRLYAIAWGISAAAAGIAGSLVSSFMYVNPLVGDVFLLPAFAAVALGGFGNVYGAFAGGLVIGVVNVTGGTLTVPKVKLALVYLVFVAVLFWRPKGLWGR